MPAAVVIMGVSGSGKTTVGRRLAEAVGWDFVDGDDFHPPANVEKMEQGTPLTDADREPWLRAIRDFLRERVESGNPVVVACSALKASYRDVLRDGTGDTAFVYLRGSYALIQQRLRDRSDHFFDADLLASQFDTLEEPDPDTATIVDVDRPPDEIVRAIQQRLTETR
jgi:gluconokinase